MKVNFYEQVDDKLLKFAVIISRHNGKWVFCKHKDRNTYEIPGGHREANEEILQTAKRELCEETGALQFDISPICVYSVTGKNRVNETSEETYGMLFLQISGHSKMNFIVKWKASLSLKFFPQNGHIRLFNPY